VPRPPRWSKRVDELVLTIAPGVRPSLQTELGQWLDGSPQFRDFVTANQDKIRKKLSTSDEETRQDVRAELRVAHALLTDRRFVVAFEAYGAGRVGPDFTVTFRSNQQFNIEVTRFRSAEPAAAAARLSNVIAAKLRQLPSDRPNALLISADGLGVTGDSVGAALRALKAHAEARDDEFFARRSSSTAREFSVGYPRLSGVFVVDGAKVVCVANPEARRALSDEIVAATTRCLSAEDASSS
jgi:hypothetical protein